MTEEVRFKILSLNKDYSTTKCLIKREPEITNNQKDKFTSYFFLPQDCDRKSEGGLRTKGYFKQSFPEKPLVTIITVVFNGEKYLEKTIKSVINQSYDNIEYIIIDGSSTDGTVDIIKKYEDKIDYWLSEKDEGIYYAMNKGISLATGDIIGIINANDFYEEDIVPEVIGIFKKKECHFTFGNVNRIDANGKEIGYTYPKDNVFNPINYVFDLPFPHPSLFIKKKVYKEIGLFNERLKISADKELVGRIISKGYKGCRLEKAIANFRSGGVSDTLFISFREYVYIAKKFGYSFPGILFRYIWTTLKIFIYAVMPKPVFNLLNRFYDFRFKMK